MRLKVGLVGCGYISSTHLEAWERSPDVQVVAVCDVNHLSMQVPVPSSPAALVTLLLSFLYYPNNVAASPLLPSFNRDPIVLSGQDWLYFGQRIWPVTSGLSGTFHTLSLHHPHGVHLLDPLGWRQHGFSTDGTGERTEADDLHRIPAPSLKILA